MKQVLGFGTAAGVFSNAVFVCQLSSTGKRSPVIPIAVLVSVVPTTDGARRGCLLNLSKSFGVVAEFSLEGTCLRSVLKALCVTGCFSTYSVYAYTRILQYVPRSPCQCMPRASPIRWMKSWDGHIVYLQETAYSAITWYKKGVGCRIHRHEALKGCGTRQCDNLSSSRYLREIRVFVVCCYTDPGDGFIPHSLTWGIESIPRNAVASNLGATTATCRLHFFLEHVESRPRKIVLRAMYRVLFNCRETCGSARRRRR